MSLDGVLRNAWNKTKDNFVRKRYLLPSNFLSDAMAGNISRTPLYVAIDSTIVGAPVENAIDSGLNSVGISLVGWSLAYAMGNSILAEAFGDTYKRHKRKIDATYSFAATFGFGLVVNAAAGYTSTQTVTASFLRAVIGTPLGPVTRHYTDAFREVRNEPSITPQGAGFRHQKLSYTAPRIAAMIALPLALMYSSVQYAKQHQPPVTVVGRTP